MKAMVRLLSSITARFLLFRPVPPVAEKRSHLLYAMKPVTRLPKRLEAMKSLVKRKRRPVCFVSLRDVCVFPEGSFRSDQGGGFFDDRS
ncbi:MAG: hypothetical protein D6679_09415 [Candidatus Hydrogenedentota bacterium]|nr:MAG: hypothetical protein D6679_09415 [Candidatus Hydrogenedentota bacterium]